MNLSKIRYGSGPAYGSQAAFIPVVKVFSRLPLQIASDILGRSFALLDRDRRNSRKPFSLFILQCGQISDHKDLGMSGNAQIGIHKHPPGAITGAPRFFPRGDAATPAAQRITAAGILVSPTWTHPGSTQVTIAEVCTLTQVPQLFFGAAGKIFRISRQMRGPPSSSAMRVLWDR